MTPATSACGLELVRAFHRGECDPSEEELDAALGLSPRSPTFAIFEDAALVERHPGESFADLPTPFPIARGLFEALDLGAEDLVYDLGCGNGRVVLYGAVVSPARLCGIEIVEDRVKVAVEAVRRSGIERATFLDGSVMDHDLAAASVFYMCRPFGEETEAKVVARLHEEARRRPITLVTHRLRPGLFDPTVLKPVSVGTLGIFRSQP